MRILLKNATVYTDKKFQKTDVELKDEKIVKIAENIESNGFDVVYDLKNMYLLPGLVDVHTHLREPGFIYKETIKTGSMAGAKGGYTSICAMPNLNPVPDCMENLKLELDAIKKDAVPMHPLERFLHPFPYFVGNVDSGCRKTCYRCKCRSMNASWRWLPTTCIRWW